MSVKPVGKNPSSVPTSFEIKSSQLATVALVLKSTELTMVAMELLEQFGPDSDNADFFDNDPVTVDLSVFEANAPFSGMVSFLDSVRRCRLIPVAARGAPKPWHQSLFDCGLAEAPVEVARSKGTSAKTGASTAVATAAANGLVQSDLAHPTRVEVIKEVPGPATMVVDKPLRSGQKIYARGADLIVLAMVNQGAEVVADGNIHVYAPLRGKAMAGARGNTQARIFSTCLEPELISIAGVYRTSEAPLPPDIAGKPAQVRLSNDGQDKLIIESLKT